MLSIHHLLLLVFFIVQYGLYAQVTVPNKNQECGVGGDSVAPTADDKTSVLGQFPWHANLYRRDEDGWLYLCGGNLISDRVVLTAAHCVIGSTTGDLKVAFAKFDRKWDQDEPYTVKRNVSAVKVPDDFDPMFTQWNMALLQLSAPVEVNRYLMPVCNDYNAARNSTGSHYVVSRRGDDKLIERKTVTIVPRDVCLKTMPRAILFGGKICARDENNVESPVFKGDSGAGLTTVIRGKHQLVGLVNLKFDKTALFTNLTWPAHTQWLNENIPPRR